MSVWLVTHLCHLFTTYYWISVGHYIGTHFRYSLTGICWSPTERQVPKIRMCKSMERKTFIDFKLPLWCSLLNLYYCYWLKRFVAWEPFVSNTWSSIECTIVVICFDWTNNFVLLVQYKACLFLSRLSSHFVDKNNLQEIHVFQKTHWLTWC